MHNGVILGPQSKPHMIGTLIYWDSMPLLKLEWTSYRSFQELILRSLMSNFIFSPLKTLGSWEIPLISFKLHMDGFHLEEETKSKFSLSASIGELGILLITLRNMSQFKGDAIGVWSVTFS